MWKDFRSLVLVIVLTLAALCTPTPVYAASVASTFTSTGNSLTLFVKNGEKFRFIMTGTWVGTIQTNESRNGGASYANLLTNSTNINTDVDAKPYDRIIRLTASSYTSGTVTYSIANIVSLTSAWKVTNIPIGSVAYASLGTNTTPVAGTWYCMDTRVFGNYTAMSGLGFLNGATVGTDKLIYALYDSTGRLIANTDTAGTTSAGASAAQEIPTLSQFALNNGIYWTCEQSNGTTTRLRTVAASTFLDKLAGSFTGTFGTVPANITPPTAFAADTGPIGYIYP